MQKLLKNSKQIFAFVFAFAILAVSMFTGNATISAEACDVSKIDYWDGTLATSLSGKGTEEEPYIITTAEELAFVCLGQTPSTSSGKYYKVSDDIKTFVMQPESVVTLDDLLALENPEAVKEYFTNLEGKINWISQFNGKSFNGNFDGNGATVYGLYATSEGTSKEDVALFPQYDGGTVINRKNHFNTCKNIAVKNSYYYSKRRLGSIVGAAYGTGYGADFSGKVTIDSCAVVNCYMIGELGDAPSHPGKWSYYGEQGVVACGGSTDVIVLKNILVKGVYAFNTEKKANINIVGNGSNVKKNAEYQNTISDSIFLGTAPYGKDYYINQVHEPHLYTNVVTDLPSGKVSLATPTWDNKTTEKDYTDKIFSVTETGLEFKNAASMLDWKNTWFMGENGPELRVFHSNIELTTTHTTHIWTCDCCGLKSAGGEVEHTFAFVGTEIKGDGKDVYMCTECDYACQHNEQTDAKHDPGDCVTKSGIYTRCKFCAWYMATDLLDAPGHKLTYVEADPGHCELNGHKEYWHCEVCDNKFASDDIMAPMDTAVTDEWLNTGLGGHLKEEDGDGVVIFYDKNGHWYKCSVDGGRLDADSNALDEGKVIKHKFEKGGSECLECDFVCTQHECEVANIEVRGDCFTDEKSKVKCMYCEYSGVVVTRKAGHTIIKKNEEMPNAQMEGTKAHYKCDACNAVFADAEGKTPITKAELVIRKTLPAEYANMYVDTSGKSPSTGDNISSVISLAVLAGVVLVVARKK